MSRIPQPIIDQVKRAPIADVIGRVVELEREGGELLGRCPFHDDDTPSLGVDVEQGLWRCRGGCNEGGDVIRWVEKFERIAFPQAVRKLAAELGIAIDDTPQLVASYTYTTEYGEELYKIERWEPGKRGRSKDFIQRRLEGGEWRPGKSARQVLYRLPEVTRAVERGELVYVVEGEKAADALADLGLCATTHAGGTGVTVKTWTPSFAEPLRGARVIVLPDADDVGRKSALHVLQVLHGVASDLRELALPAEKKGDDVVDWLARGGTRAELEQLAGAARRWQPPRRDGYACSDTGNAERFVDQHGDDVRFCRAFGKWFVWQGGRWVEDLTDEVLRRTKDTVRGIVQEAEHLDGPRRAELLRWAARSEDSGRRSAIVNLVRSEDGIGVIPEQFDQDPWLLNVANGTVDLRTGRLRPHRKEDLCTKIAPTVYDENAQCPLFDRFLAQVLPDTEVRAFMQRFFGYALTGVIREHVLPICWGSGGNGKGVLFGAVQHVIGDYARHVQAELLMARRGDSSHSTDRAQLMGLRLATASETEEGRALGEATVKALTGGDRITARFMRQDNFEFAPTHKLALMTNSKPIIRGTDNGIWRRVRLVPFTVVVPEEKQDTKLPEKLQAEASGILRWLIEGCLAWQRDGLGTAGAIARATESYRDDQDVLGQFLEERCLLGAGHRAPSTDLFKAYERWAEAIGNRPMSQTAFGRRLGDRGLDRIKTGGRKVYEGVRLLSEIELATLRTGTSEGERDGSSVPFPMNRETRLGGDNRELPSNRPLPSLFDSFTQDPDEYEDPC